MLQTFLDDDNGKILGRPASYYLLRLTSLRILQLVLRTKKVMMYYIPLLEKMTSVVAISNVVL